MKTANRVLAILLAMLMAVSTFAVAASAAASLQADIDGSDNVASISVNTKESVVIDKDLTLDLGGKILKSIEGSPAITVTNGATVTIKNGYVESFYKSYSGPKQAAEILDDLVAKSPSAIVAKDGAKVILNDVRAMGGLVRIPRSAEYFVPTGSALQLQGGATAELNNTVLIGRYGVNNKVDNAGGTVTVKDAILIGFLDYVKNANKLSYDEATVEKVNAADRIEGFLNDNVNLEPNEIDLLKKVMDDRVYVFTTKPTDDEAVVTIDRNTGFAKITAEEITDFVNTDCSYKYIPENAYDAATGETFALDTDIPAAAVEGKTIRINYRLAFQLKGDMKKYANNFDFYFHDFYNKAFQKLDAGMAELKNYYDSKVQELATNLLSTLDEAAGTPITVAGQTYTGADALGDEYYAIIRAVLKVGGVTLYNKSSLASAANGGEFTTAKFNTKLYNNGAATPDSYKIDETHPIKIVTGFDPETFDDITTTYYPVTELGVLDKVNNLIDEFFAIKGDASFAEQSNWNRYAHFIVDNYQTVLDAAKEAETALTELKTMLNTGRTYDIIKGAGMESKLSQLNTLVQYAHDANMGIDEALENSIVQDVKAKVDRHANDGTIEEYVGKIKTAANDYTEYFTPENFLLENGEFGKAYRVTGPTKVKIIEISKLFVSVDGTGTVAYVPDTAESGTTTSLQFVGIGYDKKVTLRAQAGDGYEFMYWVNADTNRILSTDKELVVNTQIKRYIIAEFEATAKAKITLTNNSGVISVCKDFSSGSYTAGASDAAYIAGFTAAGWGPNGASTITTADLTSAYASGDSAFENGAIYDGNGYGFKQNSETENKYLVTAKYTTDKEFSVYFIDNGERFGVDSVGYGKGVTFTATGSNFSYWTDEAGNIVSLYPTYKYQVVKNAVFTAVYGAEIPADNAVLNIIKVDDQASDKITFYGERSVAASEKVLSTGFIFSFSNDCDRPEIEDVDGDTVKMIVSTKTTNTGLYAAGASRDDMIDGCIARAFVELQTANGSRFVYSEPYPIG